jgi:apolipoprotein N-acyltransferase
VTAAPVTAPQSLPSRLAPHLMPLAAGTLITLSLAPFSLWPMGIVSLMLLLHSLYRCRPGKAATRGFAYGLGMYGSGASWVYVSIADHGGAGPLLAGTLTLVFCAGLALLHALFAWSYARWVRGLRGGMLLGFPALWVLFEWLRGWLLTGFPWLYVGYAHADTWLAGWAPILGVFGLSLIAALTASCAYLALRRLQIAPLVAYVTVIATLWLSGLALRDQQWVAPASTEPLTVALVQGNIPQALKWTPEHRQHSLRTYADATAQHWDKDIIVWPEAAVPAFYDEIQHFLSPMAETAATHQAALITGIPYQDRASGRYYNSIVGLGNASGVYHKQRLVPFGEYVPLESWLRGLIAFFDLPMSSFSRGPTDQDPLIAAEFRLAPSICYEVVYSDLVARAARRADLLVTISNDAWFGNSLGPLQHLEMARMRALETGRYVLRATNNGVSAVIDERGRIVAQSPQFVMTTLTGLAQPMLGRTPYVNLLSRAVIIGCVLILLAQFLLHSSLWRERTS